MIQHAERVEEELEIVKSELREFKTQMKKELNRNKLDQHDQFNKVTKMINGIRTLIRESNQERREQDFLLSSQLSNVAREQQLSALAPTSPRKNLGVSMN